tara:strand:- start:364 stop:1818 length:1455 start_codon:yes stop_codon:yes gene_type:complete
VNNKSPWPKPLRKYSIEVIRSLDEHQYYAVIEMLRRRAKKNSQIGGKYKRHLRRKFSYPTGPKGRVRNYAPTELLRWKKKDCDLLSSFYRERDQNWIPIKLRKIRSKIHDVNNFSFIDNPHETLDSLHRISKLEAEELEVRIDFKDKKISDIGPYLVWGLMRKKMAPISTGGSMDGAIQHVLNAVGLDQYLNIQLSERIPSEDIWSFPFRERSAERSTNHNAAISIPTFTKVADDLVKTIDHWLSKAITPPLALAKTGRGHVTGLVGEVLNNAERHSVPSRDGGWVVAGFMCRREAENKPQGDFICNLTFISRGMSIAESISAPEDTKTAEHLERYLSLHMPSIFKKGVDPELLKTVFALQDGNSRLLNEDSIGGIGLMDIISFTNILGITDNPDLRPRVTILSGNACIMLKDQYAAPYSPQGEETFEIEGKRMQWFNHAKSLDIAPDPDYVFLTKFKFPGTVITLRFCLDGEVLPKVAANGND